MKVLITVWKPELRELLFGKDVIRQMKAVAEVDWAPAGQPYDESALERDIGPYDAVLTSWGSPKITERVLERAPRLEFIGHAAGTLTPYVDPAVFRRDNLVLANANTALARSTAELALTLMLAGAWELGAQQSRLKAGEWSANAGTVMGLYGQQIGIVGLGEVAREVIRLLRPFDARIRLYSPYCSPEEAERLGVTLCSLDEVFRHSRIVTLHDTLTAATRGIIGREQLELLSDGALLVNTARGPLIDETALKRELASGRIHAALDVYHEEPLPKDDPLLQLPKVLCLPHIGAYSAYWKSQLGAMVAEDLIRFASGQPPLRQVTAERFARMTTR
ncbi:D-3-phosphoglycerate dehydrogenase [Paenibacillus konkukensis]|uniref:D-3-phosphoglycerate dehydrogenase n=1 Tax=Paenibacillus konkukensis TaxID=2020716 RepID=A0ABY4RJL6_9BACL|nr:hydroxyacid dehydrogenase [Paenibacillus konkukensis]UQZ82320.1 D-3-phosphoglycerate dehydrogenase [Paenibacillus konkukensis]